MQKPDAPRYYGLLYVDRNHSQHVNLRTRKDPVAVYVGCAALLAASARSAGEQFAVFTNAAKELLRIAEANGFPEFECVEIPFHLDIPSNTRFYQAHYKLCALEAMACDPRRGFSGLIDIDAVLQTPLSTRILEQQGVHAYVIDEGLAGASVGDLDMLIGPPLAPRRWFGGEFIAGDSASLGQLSAAVKMLLPRYLKAMPRLVHVGDETIVSAALNMLGELGLPIHDVGHDRIVARWYSSRLSVPQERLTDALGAAVLHLPSDKTFLQEHARRWLGPDRFRQELTRHVLAKSMVRAVFNPVLSLAEGERRYAPRL